MLTQFRVEKGKVEPSEQTGFMIRDREGPQKGRTENTPARQYNYSGDNQ